MAEQASSFFEAASAASDLGADRDLQNETRLTHLRTPSLPEVALRGELQQRASSHAMRLSASGGHVGRLSSFFEAASAASDLGADRDLQNVTRLTHLRTPSLPEVALRGELQQRASSHAMPLSASGGRIDRLSSFFEDAAVNALQPEPQSGPGSSLEDAMLGY